MPSEAGFFVAQGKSITTRRGIVGSDSPDSEITPKCLGADPKAEKDVETALKRMEDLVERGYLTRGPTTKAPETPVETAGPLRNPESSGKKSKADARRKPKVEAETEAEPSSGDPLAE